MVDAAPDAVEVDLEDGHLGEADGVAHVGVDEDDKTDVVGNIDVVVVVISSTTIDCDAVIGGDKLV